MKAVTQDGYCGPDELRFEEVPKPEIADDEVLVKVRAASVNPFDWHVMRGQPSFARLMVGLRRPKVPIRGVDVAGVVEAVGPGVTEFVPGDEVFGHRPRAFAEYVSVPQHITYRIPDSLLYEHAAMIEAVSVAVHGVSLTPVRLDFGPG